MNDENFVNVVSGLNSSIDNAMIGAESKDRIILYFGGGLSSNKYIRENLGPLLLETTFHPTNIPNSYPIITQWETSPFEVDSIKNIIKELLHINDIKKIRNWLKRKLGIDAKGLLPSKPESEAARDILISVGFTEEDIQSDNEENLSDIEIENRLEKLFFEDGDDLKEGIQSIDSTINKNTQKGLLLPIKSIKVIFRVLKRIARKTDHGLYTTIIEELCRLAIIYSTSLGDLAQGHWKQVYKTSARMWGEGAGKYFLEKLDTHCHTYINTRIDLVSHSAGSIAICHLIKELSKNQYPNIKIGNILPIAPAVRMKLFEDTIINNQNLFENFRMYTLSDQAELDDKLASILYPHSLLYFVSGIAEEKGKADMSILGMHRYFRMDGDEPYLQSRYKKKRYRKIYGDLKKIREYLAQDGMVVLSPNNTNPNNYPGLASDGDEHESTKLPNESPELSKSLIYVLSQGEVLPSNVDSSTWQEIYYKYHK